MICEFVTRLLFTEFGPGERFDPVNTSFFGDMLQSIAERGRALIDRTRDRRGVAEQRSASLVQLATISSRAAAKLRGSRWRAKFSPAMPS